MDSHQPREYLSFGDALFLHLEREGIPINIACVVILDGQITGEEFLPYVEAKLSHVPRCMQRVVAAPFNVGLPSLELDSNFDFRNHVHEVTLEHGTDSELKALAGRLFSENLDRNRPLWDFTLAHGLKGGCTGLIARIHHSMADGMSGIAFLNALMDSSPEVPRKLRKRILPTPALPKDPATNLLDTLTSSWFLTVEKMLSAQSDLLSMARQLVAKPNSEVHAAGHAGSSQITEDLSRMLPEIASSPERMPFNVVCRGPQAFEWIDLPFEDLRAIKHAFGCSFNDVALAVIATCFGRYAELRGAATGGRSLRIIVPVNTRPANEPGDGMGNQITFMPVAIPLDIRDPRKLLASVHQRMCLLKKARIAEMVGFAGALIAAIPSPVQVFLGPIAAQLPLTLCNLIFTNVPGPKESLYILGRKMVKAYPYVPIGGEMGVNCALLTYDGRAHFGFSCDVHAVPDPHSLPKLLRESVVDMQQAFGLAGKPKAAARRKPRQRAKSQTVPPPAPVQDAPKPGPELAMAMASD